LCVAALPEDESPAVFACVVAGFGGVFGVDVEDVTEESANEALLRTMKQTTIKPTAVAVALTIARILAPTPPRFGIVFRIQQKVGLACP